VNELHSGSPREPRENGLLSWRDLAERVVNEGVAKYGNLNVGVSELALWIELVRSRKTKRRRNSNTDIPDRVNKDIYLAAALAKGQPEA